MNKRNSRVIQLFQEGKILSSSGTSLMKEGEEVILYGVPKMFIPSIDGYGYLLLEDDPELVEYPGYVMVRFKEDHQMYDYIKSGELMKFAGTTACCKGIIVDKKIVNGKEVTLLDENSDLRIFIDN